MGEIILYVIAIPVGVFALGWITKKSVVVDPKTGKKYYEVVDGVNPVSFRLVPVPEDDDE